MLFDALTVHLSLLIFMYALSADDKTLDSYNIAAGATIHMVLQLRGGSR